MRGPRRRDPNGCYPTGTPEVGGVKSKGWSASRPDASYTPVYVHQARR